jgi:PncC family amidohydrolase
VVVALFMNQEAKLQETVAPSHNALLASVGQALLNQHIQLALAESCTGGLLSSSLTNVPGSSAYTTLNVVTYSNEAKIKLLGVEPALLEQYGAVSKEVALAMAKGLLVLAHPGSGSQDPAHQRWAFSVTGIAGPGGGSPQKPVGLVYFALATVNSTTPVVSVFNSQFQVASFYPRLLMKQLFVEQALTLLQLSLNQQPWPAELIFTA